VSTLEAVLRGPPVADSHVPLPTVFGPLTPNTEHRTPFFRSTASCRLPSALCRLSSAICPPSTVHCPLSSVHCRLPSALCRLSSVHCRLPSALCRLSSVVCPLPSALCPLSSVVCRLSTAVCPLPPPPYLPNSPASCFLQKWLMASSSGCEAPPSTLSRQEPHPARCQAGDPQRGRNHPQRSQARLNKRARAEKWPRQMTNEDVTPRTQRSN